MPCVSRESTYDPHGQLSRGLTNVCTESQSDHYTLIVSSSSLNPQAEMGSAWSQSLLCGALTTSILALLRSSLQLSNKMPTAVSIAALSKALCLRAESMLGSAELDPVPTWVIQKFAVELSPFIAALFNASMSGGYFPTSQKIASITPILKKASLDPLDLGNHRPISNLT